MPQTPSGGGNSAPTTSPNVVNFAEYIRQYEPPMIEETLRADALERFRYVAGPEYKF
jgi:hypothetical protein